MGFDFGFEADWGGDGDGWAEAGAGAGDGCAARPALPGLGWTCDPVGGRLVLELEVSWDVPEGAGLGCTVSGWAELAWERVGRLGGAGATFGNTKW